MTKRLGTVVAAVAVLGVPASASADSQNQQLSGVTGSSWR
jgi:hypothetical protein